MDEPQFNLNEALKESETYKQAYAEHLNGKARDRIFSFNDAGNAERLIARHGAHLHYCYSWKKWLLWDGTRWAFDETGEIFRRAKETARAIATEEAKHIDDDKQFKMLLSWSRNTLNEAKLHAMISSAQSEPGIALKPDAFDTQPWLLNCLNGTLDLRTGTLHPHQRKDLLTKCLPIPYEPEASCPRWETFLDDIFQGNQELIGWIWRAVGYSLTGDIREQCLFLLHGSGANGKSTFLKTLRSLLGDYANKAAFSTFLHKEKEAVRDDVADLRGARLVIASEADEGKRLSEALIKEVTGGESMKARHLFQSLFEFAPQLKLWLGSNHKPEIKGTDHAIWRRLRLVPFHAKFEGDTDDKTLGDTLKTELPGILRWAVLGCQAWQEEGLDPPEIIRGATASYRAEMDVLGNFINECCIVKPDAQANAGELLTRYQEYTGDKKMTHQKFRPLLENRGFVHDRSTLTGLRVWKGLSLLASSPSGD